MIGSATATSTVTDIFTNGTTLLAGTKTFVARQTEQGKGESANSLGVTVVIDTTPPATPTTPDLLATSDNGANSTDNVTSFTAVSFSGSAPANGLVRLFRNLVLVASGNASSTGKYLLTVDDLSLGNHSFTARSIDAAGNPSPFSPALSVKVVAAGNNAPQLDKLFSPTLSPIAEDNRTSFGTPIWSLLGGVTDADAGALRGLAIYRHRRDRQRHLAIHT